jgi:hypothetical protein
MKLTLEDAYLVIEKNITGKLRHPHYKRVNDLAKLYHQLITGHDIDSLLAQFSKREDQDLFNQRKTITQVITPAVSASVQNPFYKVGRVNNITKKISFSKTDKTNEKKQKIEDALLSFYGEKSLDSYMQTRFIDLSFCDPNSFIVTEFDQVEIGPNNEMTALPKPRPFEVSSKEAVNYVYDNNILQWLLVELPTKYKKKDGGDTDGLSYTLYFPEFAIVYSQVDVENFNGLGIGKTGVYSNGVESYEVYRADEKRAFLIREHEHKSKIIPAVRVGYKRDLVTCGATCVNPFHDALPYFMKSIKTVSEFDLTMCLHAFPQKFQYVNRCLGEGDYGCTGGKTNEGTTCTRCKGSGVAIHTSAQDGVVIRMPKNKEEMIDLEQMVHYEYPPIELLEFQNKYIQQLKNEVFGAVFNSDQFQKPTIEAVSATEIIVTADEKNNTITPFAEKYSDVYVQVAKVAAHYLDEFDVVILHHFPKDFKFKTQEQLLSELKLARDSDAPGYIRKELANEIAEQQFIDKPEELKRIRTKEKLFPFPDKSSTEIVYIISNGKTSLFNEILWSNFDTIFSELEIEMDEKQENLYDQAPKKIKELIKVKVDAIISEITVTTPVVAGGLPSTDDE